MVGRYYQSKLNYPGRFFSSCAMVGLVYSTMVQRRKFDYPFLNIQNDLEQNLELSPMTRKAYQEALLENQRFQRVLK